MDYHLILVSRAQTGNVMAGMHPESEGVGLGLVHFMYDIAVVAIQLKMWFRKGRSNEF